MRNGLVGRCLNAANQDPLVALAYAVRATRWRLIAAGKLDADQDEPLPLEVRRARAERASRARAERASRAA